MHLSSTKGRAAMKKYTGMQIACTGPVVTC